MIPWNVDDGVTAHLPNMNTDITLKSGEKTLICLLYTSFEIFLGRMMMCRGAADMLGATFKLMANGSKVL